MRCPTIPRPGRPTARGGLLPALIATAVLLLAACSARSTAASAPNQPKLPAGAAAVASWQVTGGYSAAGVLTLRPPRLVVYPDGQTITDAAYRTDLTVDDVSRLVDVLAADLKTPTPRPSGAAPVPPDAPTTILAVRSVAGTTTVRADGLDEVRDERGYPDQLYDARDRLDTLYKRIVAAGQPYTADHVRVVVEPVTGDATGPTGGTGPSTAAVRPWPTDLDVPQSPAANGTRAADLTGEPARTAVRLLDRDLDLNGSWTTYRAADGSLLRASWRYLLPDE